MKIMMKKEYDIEKLKPRKNPYVKKTKTKDDFMSSLFDDLKQGLEEAVAYEKGTGKAKEKIYMILPVKEYSGKQIREVRMKAGMSQRVFCFVYGSFY